MIGYSTGVVRIVSVMMVLSAGLLVTPLARADQTLISPGPLTAIGVNSDLSCSVNYVGDNFGEFFGDTACGTFLDVGGAAVSGGTVYGANNLPAAGSVNSTPFIQDAQTPISGDGSAGSPFTVSTQVDAGTTGLSLTQTDSYVSGADQYKTTVLITNSSSSAQPVSLYHAADCYLGNDDHGYGYQDNASGGIFCTKNANNNPAGRVEGFIPVDGGSNSLETSYGANWQAVGSGQPLPDTCDCSALEDNGMSISWTATVPAGGSITRSWATDFSPVGTIRASSYVALGDSVAAGEGINENWSWTGNTWSQGQPFPWDTTSGQPNSECHQSLEGYPHVLEGFLSAQLLDLACTGASTSNGILGPEPGKSDAQLGGGLGAPNPTYDNASPDIVTLTVGANDVNFADKVAACYRAPYLLQSHACGSAGDKATLLSELGDFRVGLNSVLSEIQTRGVADGKIPIVAITEYYSPFPNTYPTHSSCIDISPNRRAGITLTNSEMQYLNWGLLNLNGTIDDVATQFPNVVIVPAPVSFSDHRWCSADPWVYGPSLDTSLAGHFVNPAPFHPTPEGQNAIANNIASYLADERHVDTGGEIPANFGAISLLFRNVQTAGTAFFTALGAVNPSSRVRAAREGTVRVADRPSVAAAPLPPASRFAPVQFYSAGTSAVYSSGLTVTLPSLGAADLYEDINGAWQLIPTTSDGAGNLTGTLTTLGPLALGNPAPAVRAALTVAGDNAQAPDTVSFDASSSTAASGSITSYAWDFGDGNTATGQTATNAYQASGTYTVTLKVTSDLGATDVVSHTVTVVNSPPVAVVTASSTATAGVAAGGFDASASHASDGPVAEVDWDFGDGTDPVSGNTQTHTFANPGTYTVTTTVWDAEGANATQTSTVVVTTPQTPATPTTATTTTPVAPPFTPVVPRTIPVLKLSSRLLLDRRGRLEVKLTCVPHLSACQGVLTVTTGSGRKVRTVARRKYSLASGRTATLALALPAKLTATLRKRRKPIGVRAALRQGKAVAVRGRPVVAKRGRR